MEFSNVTETYNNIVNLISITIQYLQEQLCLIELLEHLKKPLDKEELIYVLQALCSFRTEVLPLTLSSDVLLPQNTIERIQTPVHTYEKINKVPKTKSHS